MSLVTLIPALSSSLRSHCSQGKSQNPSAPQPARPSPSSCVCVSVPTMLIFLSPQHSNGNTLSPILFTYLSSNPSWREGPWSLALQVTVPFSPWPLCPHVHEINYDFSLTNLMVKLH